MISLFRLRLCRTALAFNRLYTSSGRPLIVSAGMSSSMVSE
jgi:hypothetical protein